MPQATSSQVGKGYLVVTQFSLCFSKFTLRMEWRSVRIEAGGAERRLVDLRERQWWAELRQRWGGMAGGRATLRLLRGPDQ